MSGAAVSEQGPAQGLPDERSARLRQHACETWELTLQLESERAGLRQLCDGLHADCEVLAREREALGKECDGLAARIEDAEARYREAQAQVQALEDEVAIMQLATRALERQRERLSRQRGKLDAETARERQRLRAASAALDGVTGTLVRIDYKLEHGSGEAEGEGEP